MAECTKMVLIMEYDGTNYYGFQLQANQPTVQGEIESALLKLTGEKLRVLAASRTDTGVHAREQVVSFRTVSSLPEHAFVGGLNHYLPEDIAVRNAFRVSDACNVRRNAVSREYHYLILNRTARSPIQHRFAHHVPGRLDTAAMNEACQHLIGEHDFVSFATALEKRIKSTVRRVYQADVIKDSDLITFRIIASSFLPHQVRNTVGALIRVGLGKMTVDEFRSILEVRTPGLAGPTAPAHGLCLMRVNYPHSWEELRN
ncbi:MAG TPA: tRNA pseudouridine(38-40) synthase TruA [Dehalococcoidales bacterium]|nr:tRNA pseudouridine(38-40) synthase TruA [Dehalococcoidales bacterium]